MRNIPPVANIDLFPRIIDSGIGIRRVFKFYHTDRKPIDKQKEFAGILKAFDKDTITIAEESGERVLNRAEIALVRLALDF